MKEICFSDHAQLKMEVLASHAITIDPDFVIETIRFPDKLKIGEEDKLIAQKQLDENLVLRVVYREFDAFIAVATKLRTLGLKGVWGQCPQPGVSHPCTPS